MLDLVGNHIVGFPMRWLILLRIDYIWVGWSQSLWLSLDNQFDFCNLKSSIKCDDNVESQISYSLLNEHLCEKLEPICHI